MDTFVVLAVLFGALLHAGWNALVKSSGDKELDIALVHFLGAIASLPLLLLFGMPPREAWPFIGASLFVPGSSALVAAGYSAGFATAAGAAATVAFSIGLSLALTGVSQLLSPDPGEQDTGSSGSTLMGGQVNTTSSDAVVPWAFGRVLVGSVVTSAGYSTVQLT